MNHSRVDQTGEKPSPSLPDRAAAEASPESVALREARGNRRSFFKAAVGAAAVGAAAVNSFAARAASPQAPLLRLGGPLFAALRDPEGLAIAHRKLGYRAAYCPEVSLDDRQGISDITKAFAKHDVALAEVGRWCNLLDADPAKRAANLKNVAEGLALAEALGARGCVDIAGSFSREVVDGPASAKPVEGLLRRGRGKRPQDHRLRAADAGEVLLRDDGLVAAGLSRFLRRDDQGGGPPGVRRRTSTCATSSTARRSSTTTRR